MKIGLIGCGNIGKFVLQSVNINGLLPGSRIEGVYSRHYDHANQIASEFVTNAYSSVSDLLQSDIDLVIEAANIYVVKDYAPVILESGKDLLIISVGALAELAFYEQLRQLCQDKKTKIYLPSGAIGGLDVLKAAMSVGQLDSVSITTRKPPQALPGAPLDSESILFEGSASKAIALFPQNINVSIILSLVGLGADKTNVKIISDPGVAKNSHCIEAAGSFGRLKLQVENDPMPNNPKTSFLAALSVLSTLKSRNEFIQVG
ncbi:aspartate dehydrogenase [Ammoniphilus resinae]|uniref:L-aspartate dehydrogenase n=1 Tax=Ammoniphilus resinae TaxID=861532 RepID=A0ABS4GM15_9BACL|nr:aspartate dehydrogenase [Ammoniphilus resinae]MBP1931289.1 aspartate dehydrogenase [Ammoniphilus resinae]